MTALGGFKQRFVLLKGGIFVCGEPNWIGISYYFMNEEEVSKFDSKGMRQ
jgi:hypothetical protein